MIEIIILITVCIVMGFVYGDIRRDRWWKNRIVKNGYGCFDRDGVFVFGRKLTIMEQMNILTKPDINDRIDEIIDGDK